MPPIEGLFLIMFVLLFSMFRFYSVNVCASGEYLRQRFDSFVDAVAYCESFADANDTMIYGDGDIEWPVYINGRTNLPESC